MSVAILRSDRPDIGEQSIAQETLERGDGRAELRFERRNGATALAHLYQRSPCRILFPNSAEGDLPVAVMVTTSGGLAGGDRLHIEMGAGAGAKAVVTAQAAEKIYRSLADQYLVMDRGEVVKRGAGADMEKDGVKELLAV